jgi:hypothetical protein
MPLAFSNGFQKFTPFQKKILLTLLVIAVSGCAAALAFSSADFDVYYDAALSLRAGRNPYEDVTNFNSPLSVLLYFLPMSFLPRPLAFRLTIFLSVAVYCAAIYKMSGRNLINTLIALLSPLFLYHVFYNNVDWLPMLGAIVRPEWAFWLAMTKPQIGIIIAAVACLTIRERQGWRRVAVLVAAQAAIYAVSFSMGMAWGWMLNRWGNFSVFPFGLVAGIPLAGAALIKRKSNCGLAAAPLMSPYVGPQSWIAVLPVLAERRWAIMAAAAVTWGLVLLLLR